MEDRFLSVRDAAAYLGVHRSTLDHWRIADPVQGPTFVRLGAHVKYRWSELDRYVDERTNLPHK